MNSHTFIKNLTGKIFRGLLLLCLLPALIWFSPVMPQALASESVAPSTIANNSVERGLDRLKVEGAVDKVQGRNDEAIGKVQRSVGKITGQSEGAIKEAEGQAEQAIGNAKQNASKAGDRAKERSESLIDKIKSIFD